jgi:nucleotide-binding universal stress UspA family protein
VYKRIVVPLDGSAAAECVLAHVRDIAVRGAEIVLMRVAAKPDYDYTLRDPELSACLDDESAKEAYLYLEKAAAAVKKAGVTVTACVLAEQGPIARSIWEFARKSKADLIAISAHGRPGIIGRLLGSVTERIIHRSGIPVLVVHP